LYVVNVTGAMSRPVGIKDIAKALGVSIGTVDRALHGRPGISPVTRKKILNKARSLGYKPNLAARMLSSRQERSISVNLPRDIQSFFDPLRQGIAEAARAAEASGFRAEYRTYPRLGEGEIEAFEAALQQNIHGIIIVPGDPDKLKPLIRKASSRNIPVVCVATDAPGTERLAAVCVDPAVNGAMAAELMARFLSSQGRIAVFTGSLGTTDHQQKLEGFRQTLASFAPSMEIAAVLETHDNVREAYRKSTDALAAAPDIRGIYVSTANSMPVLRAVEESGRAGRVAVIATDLFPELVSFIQSGAVAATIHQRPFNQGRMAFQTLQKFLVEGFTPSPVVKLAPQVVMRSNLSLFLPRERFEPENVEI
jgi:LacI family transcriptional regulator